VFMRELDLPRGPDREIVHDARDRQYTPGHQETPDGTQERPQRAPPTTRACGRT
jgi:hypothetical protein